jgi:hypothetical protein
MIFFVFTQRPIILLPKNIDLSSLINLLVVANVTRLQAASPGVQIPEKARLFLLSKSSTSTTGPTDPPIQWASGLLTGLERTRCARSSDYSHSYTAEVKND